MSMNIVNAIEKLLKVDRKVEIDERLLPIARKVCLELKIDPKVGWPRFGSGDRMKSRRLIWFTDTIQKDRFLEALSMVEKDPGEPIKPEHTVYVETGADRRS